MSTAAQATESQATAPGSEDAAQQAAAALKQGEQLTDEQLWDQANQQRSTQADADEQGGEGEQPDPLAGLPEPTRKLVEQIQAKTVEQDAALKEVGQKLAKAHGTIGNLTKQLQDNLSALQQLKPAADAVAASKKAAEEAEAAKTAARRKELEDSLAEMPEIVEYVNMKVADAKPAVKADPEKSAAQESSAEESPEAIRARLTAERELSDRHPKWIEKVRSTEFKTWLTAQPDDIKALGASDDVADADKMLTMYEKHQEDAAAVAKLEAERQARLRRNETVEGTGSAQKGGDSSKGSLWEQAKRERARAQAQT